MANINFEELTSKMLQAAEAILQKHWSDTKPYAEKEFKAFCDNIKLIDELKTQGKITEAQAKNYLDIQKSSMKIVLLTIQGLEILSMEAAINAAIEVIKSTVNTAIGWSIL